MKDLVWELFLMLREVMPNNEANTKRQHEWAAKFHELAIGQPEAQLEKQPEAPAADDDDEDPAEDPHEHGTPARPKAATRKKR